MAYSLSFQMPDAPKSHILLKHEDKTYISQLSYSTMIVKLAELLECYTELIFTGSLVNILRPANMHYIAFSTLCKNMKYIIYAQQNENYDTIWVNYNGKDYKYPVPVLAVNAPGFIHALNEYTEVIVHGDWLRLLRPQDMDYREFDYVESLVEVPLNNETPTPTPTSTPKVVIDEETVRKFTVIVNMLTKFDVNDRKLLDDYLAKNRLTFYEMLQYLLLTSGNEDIIKKLISFSSMNLSAYNCGEYGLILLELILSKNNFSEADIRKAWRYIPKKYEDKAQSMIHIKMNSFIGKCFLDSVRESILVLSEFT